MTRILIAKLAYGMWQRAEIGDWQFDVLVEAQGRPDYEVVGAAIINQLDVPSARNMASYMMEERGCDALCMVDYDMVPNLDFVRAGAEHLARHPASIIAAAYRSGWPDRKVQARRAVPVSEAAPAGLAFVSNAEAATLTGIEEVAVIGTGLCMVGKAAFDLLPWSEGPRFEYGYAPHPPFSVEGTEDTVFCRKLRQRGGKVFISWDHWCGHDKRELVGRPEPTTGEIDGDAVMAAAGWETVGR